MATHWSNILGLLGHLQVISFSLKKKKKDWFRKILWGGGGGGRKPGADKLIVLSDHFFHEIAELKRDEELKLISYTVIMSQAVH